jgi:sensor histidine kinase YesM
LPELKHLTIPPMTLQPLVENSIKYAISPRIEGGHIAISAQRENGQLILSVCDDGPGFAVEQIASGHSIDNLSARLKNMIGDKSKISVHSDGQGAAVTISLPATTTPVT